MDIKDRIKLIMEQEHMNAGAFADSIGVQQSTLSHVMNERNRPSLDLILKIHQHYPHTTLDWLIYGKGEMEDRSPDHDETGESSPFDYPSLFDQDVAEEKPSKEAPVSNKPQEVLAEAANQYQKPTVIQEIKYIEKPAHKITEIRIFFDDNTYEIFRPEK